MQSTTRAPNSVHVSSVNAILGVATWQLASSSSQSLADGHAAPLPLCAVLSVHVRSAADSQLDVQALHDPAQSTAGGGGGAGQVLVRPLSTSPQSDAQWPSLPQFETQYEHAQPKKLEVLETQ